MLDRSIEQYREILRRDLYAFIHRAFLALNPHTRFLPHDYIELIAAHLEKARRSEIRRLIINMPPRALKSHCASIVFPAWLLGHNPSAQIIAVSYGQDLADRLARECRTLMSTQFYEALFSTRLSAEKQATAEFETIQKGCRLSTSVGGVLTGRGADFIIIDDPLKPDEAISDLRRKSVNEWYDTSLYSRLNSKASGVIIIIMQRLHEDDLVGHVLGREPWHVLSLPAIAERDEEYTIETPYGHHTFRRKSGEALHPEREPLAVLAHIRDNIGIDNFAGQYLQSPAPPGGGIIKAEWFQIYDRLPEKFDSIVQSWDTASVAAELSSFSVCTTWGVKEKHLYLIDVFRERLDYPSLKRAVRARADAFSARVVLIENKASGIQLIQELLAEGLPGVTKYEPDCEKIMRMHAQTGLIENGFVHLPGQAPWLSVYLHELVTFPNGTYDDQVDSTSQALDWINRSSRNSCAGWVEHYRRLAEKTLGKRFPPSGAVPTPAKPITMIAPAPHLSYYMSGTNGRAGRYTAGADGIIENVHPEDVERLLALGCTYAEEALDRESQRQKVAADEELP
jgi:predicted phage terminase large subunit-like protein